jgi:UDP-glucose 4-epimerase
MKVLVTGSSGFIGTNLMKLLGHRGVPFDLQTGQDLGSRYGIEARMAGCSAVVHLAAETGVEQSIQKPEVSLDNVTNIQRLLECCRQNNVALFMASTAGALSGAPRSPYAASKLAGEAYCSAYAYSYQLRTTVLRFGNVYGPWSGQKQTAIPALCRSLLDGIPFQLYGDGSQRRDFVYVEDLCRGIIKAVDTGAEGQFNLASGKLVRLDKVIETLVKVSGFQLDVIPMRARGGEAVPEKIDISGAVEEFGFSPSTGLADGLKQTWDWFCSSRAAAAGISR